MAERQNSGIALAVVGIVAYMGYKYFVKPDIIDPKRLVTYSKRIRVTMPTLRIRGDNVEFDAYIQNPNPTPLTINAIVGDVFITYQKKRIKLGNVFKYGNVVIKPLAETKYSFAIRLKFLPLLAYFQDILAGRAAGQTASFAGTITIDNRPWPIVEQLKIS